MARTVSIRSIPTTPPLRIVSLRSVPLAVARDYLVHASHQALGIEPLEAILQIERLSFDPRRYIAIARNCRKQLVCLYITAPDSTHVEYACLGPSAEFKRALLAGKPRSISFQVKGYNAIFTVVDQRNKVSSFGFFIPNRHHRL